LPVHVVFLSASGQPFQRTPFAASIVLTVQITRRRIPEIERDKYLTGETRKQLAWELRRTISSCWRILRRPRRVLLVSSTNEILGVSVTSTYILTMRRVIQSCAAWKQVTWDWCCSWRRRWRGGRPFEPNSLEVALRRGLASQRFGILSGSHSPNSATRQRT
jgi:hypothetical protein